MNLPRRSIFLVLIVLAAIIPFVWLVVRSANPQTYRNNTYGFSLRLPADYTVTEVPNANPPAENGAADIIEFAHPSRTSVEEQQHRLCRRFGPEN
jgi:hypothetical protein